MVGVDSVFADVLFNPSCCGVMAEHLLSFVSNYRC